MTFPARFNVTSLNGKNGLAFINNLGDPWFGQIVSNIGDINNDGRSDLLVASTSSSQAYVLYGADSFPARFYTSNLNGTSGFLLIGESSTDFLGCAAAGVGDINGDGMDDFSVGTCGAAGVVMPKAHIIFGAKSFHPRLSLSSLDGENGFKVIIGNTNHGFGSAGSVGDINGDGISDFILGDSSREYMNYNMAYVLYGASRFPAVLNLLDLNGENGFTVVGSSANYFGAFVAGLGDFNNDTKSDFSMALEAASQAFVIFGADKFPAVVYTSNLNGTNGFIITGLLGGALVANIGDINGDYLPDLGISCMNANDAFLIFGARHFNATLSVSELDGSNGVKLLGPSSAFGIDISKVGIDDKPGVIVGAPATGPTKQDGSAFVFFSSDHFPPEFPASSLNGTNGFEIIGPSNALLGVSVASIDNFAGDGKSAIVVGAPFENTTYIIWDVT